MQKYLLLFFKKILYLVPVDIDDVEWFVIFFGCGLMLFQVKLDENHIIYTYAERVERNDIKQIHLPVRIEFRFLVSTPLFIKALLKR